MTAPAPPGEARRSPPPAARAWRARNVVVLGVVSLLTDTASEMVVPLLPALLGVLGAGAFALGVVEGCADAMAALLRFLSGRWADRTGRCRPFVLGGYGLSALVRPLFALATAPAHVVAVRVVDRAGKGLRGSPRDLLLARSVPEAQRGAAFGFHRAMDHAGAALGPLIAFVALAWAGVELRTLFWWTAVPGLLVVLVIVFGVRERTAPEAEAAPPAPPPAGGTTLPRFLAVFGLATLGRASDLFLMALAGVSNVALEHVPLLWMAMHVARSLAAFAGGHLADRIGRRRVVALGWSLDALVLAAFAFAGTPLTVWLLCLAHGTVTGTTEGPEKALVARLAPPALTGTAFGTFHLVHGLLGLAASLWFGAVWAISGPTPAFLLAATLLLTASLTVKST